MKKENKFALHFPSTFLGVCFGALLILSVWAIVDTSECQVEHTSHKDEIILEKTNQSRNLAFNVGYLKGALNVIENGLFDNHVYKKDSTEYANRN